MVTIEVTEQQAVLIGRALDFYSRIGIGQFDHIKDHPTFEQHLSNEFRIKSGQLEIGDKTMRGEVVDICPKGKWVKTKGSWGKGEEIKTWKDGEKVEHAVDYARYHEARESIDLALYQARNMLYNDNTLSRNGSWGIYNPKVDESCRVAYDILQVLRYERNLASENPSQNTVDTYKHLSTKDSDKIKVNIKNTILNTVNK